MNISTEQIVASAQTGVEFLNRETTMIPGTLKNQLSVLEAVLTGIGQGALIVAQSPKSEVKLGSEPTENTGDGNAKGRENQSGEEGRP